MRDRLFPLQRGRVTAGQSGREVARGTFHEEKDRGAFGPPEDLGPREDFPAGAVREAVLRSLDLEGFVVDRPEEGELRVDYGRVRAISVVGVHGLGPKPVLLIDVLVDGAGAQHPLSALRLRSDRFDPVRLAPGSRSGIEALRTLVGQLLAGSEASPLPDSRSVVLRPPKVFESIPAYEQEVLGPAGRRFA